MQPELTRMLHDPERLAVLHTLGLLDPCPDPAFDRLTRLAATILQTPAALVVILDADRQVFKSQLGVAEPWASRRETPLAYSFCQHALLSAAPLVVADARQHPVFITNAAVQELGVVAYLGIPLVIAGHVIGSFCVFDSQPRGWTPRDIEILQELATVVMAEIELRRERREHHQAEAAVRESEARFRQL